MQNIHAERSPSRSGSGRAGAAELTQRSRQHTPQWRSLLEGSLPPLAPRLSHSEAFGETPRPALGSFWHLRQKRRTPRETNSVERRGGPLMDSAYVQIATRLLAALLAGGMIGLERSHRGRQAGFREHTLVCVATCQLMLIGVYDWHGGAIVAQAYDVSASRVIQGIMSGIGFLGAGGHHQRRLLGERADDSRLDLDDGFHWGPDWRWILLSGAHHNPADVEHPNPASLAGSKGPPPARSAVVSTSEPPRCASRTGSCVDPYGTRFFSFIRERLLCW